MAPLEDIVCLVTGASRGIGRGIALALAEHGATVYITGRTLKPGGNKVGGSLEETCAEMNARGGKAVPVAVDHSNEKEVIALFDQIRREQNGRLDLLVNNAYSAVNFLSEAHGKAFYEIDSCSPGEAWDNVNNVGLRNNYVCATLATRLMMDYQRQVADARPGLIINISSFGGKRYIFGTAYGCGKAAVDRMTSDMALELKRNKVNISIVSLWPGIVRTEELVSRAENAKSQMLSLFTDHSFSESTELAGFAVAALASEDKSSLMSRSGDIVLVSDLALQYGLREPDGSVPPDYRSIKLLLRMQRSSIASFFPSFIRVPKSIFMGIMANSASDQPK